MKNRIILALCGAGAVSGALLFPLAKPVKVGSETPSKHPALAPKDGTQRQTAQPWNGSLDIFETPGRDEQLRLPRVFADLKIGAGSRVADVGAGGGWLSVRLAKQVGPRGVVYAQEILPPYVAAIQKRAKSNGFSNIQTILGTTSDPKLPAKTLDAALVLNAYHEFDQPLNMLGKIRAAMKPGARLGIMERDNDELRLEARRAYAQTGRIVRRVDEKTDGNPITDDHRLALDIVKREGERAGFRFVSSRELGDDHYVAVFAAP